jgi:hypothetical protein
MVLPLTRRTVLFVSCLGARGKRRILAVSLVSQKAMGIKGMSKRGIAISVLNSEETTLPTTPVFAAGGQKKASNKPDGSNSVQMAMANVILPRALRSRRRKSMLLRSFSKRSIRSAREHTSMPLTLPQTRNPNRIMG